MVTIAKAYSNRGMTMADLIEEGNLGLLRAVEGYDPVRDTRFSTYAAWWIKQAIKRALINSVQPIHIPAYMVEMIAKWKQASNELQAQFNRQPTLQELAEYMQLPERKVRIIRRAVKAVSSHKQSGGTDGNYSLAEMLADDKTPAPDAGAFDETDTQVVRGLLNQIDDREAKILRMRFGIDEQEPMTLKEIGARIGLTRERVRQIEHEALRKLNELLATKAGAYRLVTTLHHQFGLGVLAGADAIGHFQKLIPAGNERIDDNRIEVLAPFVFDHRPRDDRFECRLVDAHRGERVIDVGERHDSRGQRDVRALPSVRIARAVEALVMAGGDVCAHGEKAAGIRVPRRHAESLGADDRVALHDLEFGAAELAGFEENHVGHAHLADVVQRAGPPEILEKQVVDLFRVRPLLAQADGEDLRVTSHAFEMLARFGVA